MEILFLKSPKPAFRHPWEEIHEPSFSLLKAQTPNSLLSYQFRSLCAQVSVQFSETVELIEPPCRKSTNSRARVKVSDAQVKDNWLSSLSCCIPAKTDVLCDDDEDLRRRNNGSDWVIGVDPDVSGALALLRTNQMGTSAQVFDSPYVQMLVGKRVRKRLDPKSIVQLVTSLEAPMGTVAYIEQSTPFPKDGKLGWWSGGFGYGLWIGILVASGFSVVPISSSSWKNGLELSGSRYNKDSSRNLASELFPSLSPMLKRKKDHGRAEALLIAVYGQRCRVKPDEASTPQELI